MKLDTETYCPQGDVCFSPGECLCVPEADKLDRDVLSKGTPNGS